MASPISFDAALRLPRSVWSAVSPSLR